MLSVLYPGCYSLTRDGVPDKQYCAVTAGKRKPAVCREVGLYSD